MTAHLYATRIKSLIQNHTLTQALERLDDDNNNNNNNINNNNDNTSIKRHTRF